jgi:hypothetical protein
MKVGGGCWCHPSNEDRNGCRACQALMVHGHHAYVRSWRHLWATMLSCEHAWALAVSLSTLETDLGFWVVSRRWRCLLRAARPRVGALRASDGRSGGTGIWEPLRPRDKAMVVVLAVVFAGQSGGGARLTRLPVCSSRAAEADMPQRKTSLLQVCECAWRARVCDI